MTLIIKSKTNGLVHIDFLLNCTKNWKYTRKPSKYKKVVLTSRNTIINFEVGHTIRLYNKNYTITSLDRACGDFIIKELE